MVSTCLLQLDVRNAELQDIENLWFIERFPKNPNMVNLDDLKVVNPAKIIQND